MSDTLEKIDDRAITMWETVIDPFPIFGDVLFMLYFKHRDHPMKFFHGQYKSIYDARKEQSRLVHDLDLLRCDKFQEKYRIGYDLKRSLL